MESNFESLIEEFKGFDKNNKRGEPLFNLENVKRLADKLGSMVDLKEPKLSKKPSLSM